MDLVLATRRDIAESGVENMTVDDLAAADLPALEWAGNARHLQGVAEVLDRAGGSGTAEYLAVRTSGGAAVAIGAVNYAESPGVGVLFQLSTHPELRSLGLGTRLVREAEARIRLRGLGLARLGVEDDNPSARALYERLGYEPVGRRQVGWESQGADGELFWYQTEITELDKQL